jgi:hypothetical protein
MGGFQGPLQESEVHGTPTWSPRATWVRKDLRRCMCLGWVQLWGGRARGGGASGWARRHGAHIRPDPAPWHHSSNLFLSPSPRSTRARTHAPAPPLADIKHIRAAFVHTIIKPFTLKPLADIKHIQAAPESRASEDRGSGGMNVAYRCVVVVGGWSVGSRLG